MPIAAKILPFTAQGKTQLSQRAAKVSIDRARLNLRSPRERHDEDSPETVECAVDSFTYTARRPFHPQKFYDFLHGESLQNRIIRAKGYFWLASRPKFAGQWNQASDMVSCSFAGIFWNAIPREQWPEDKDYLEAIHNNWQEPFGDMRQELVFMGQNLNLSHFIHTLNNCLLSDDELEAGREYWQTLTDPFPSWETEGRIC